VGDGGALVGDGGAFVGDGGAAVGGTGAPSHTQKSGGQFGGLKLQFALHQPSVTMGEIAWQLSPCADATPRVMARPSTEVFMADVFDLYR